MSRITKDQAQIKLTTKGIEIIGDFVNASVPTTLRCIEKGHVWETAAGKYTSGPNRCPFCANRAKLSVDMINERIKSKNIIVIGDVIGSNRKALFKCLVCNHEWHSTPDNVMRISSCPRCANRITHTAEQINLEIRHRDIEIIGAHTNALTATTFRCMICEHRWEATPNSVKRGSGCPACSTYGFNPQKAGWEYVLDFGYFLKFGITNDLTRRLREHRKNGSYSVVHTRYHAVGQMALDWENNIKRTYGGRYATKEQCPDGWTETLCISKMTMILESHVKDGG